MSASVLLASLNGSDGACPMHHGRFRQKSSENQCVGSEHNFTPIKIVTSISSYFPQFALLLSCTLVPSMSFYPNFLRKLFFIQIYVAKICDKVWKNQDKIEMDRPNVFTSIDHQIWVLWFQMVACIISTAGKLFLSFITFQLFSTLRKVLLLKVYCCT